MKHKPSEADSNCEDCGESKGRCECDALAVLYDEVAFVMAKLDELAEVWGDEAVFRRCRDSLRKSLAKVEYERDSPALEPGPAPLVWSSERPTKAGWYFLRNTADRVAINLWWIDEEEMKTAWVDSVEFAGPIAAPLEPATGEGEVGA